MVALNVMFAAWAGAAESPPTMTIPVKIPKTDLMRPVDISNPPVLPIRKTAAKNLSLPGPRLERPLALVGTALFFTRLPFVTQPSLAD
jgi:hypothetical protein